MLIVDMSNLVFGSVSDFMKNSGVTVCDMGLFRNIVVPKLKSAKDKLKTYSKDEIVIACDSTNGYWRKEIHPNYKAGRREDSTIDWNSIFRCFDEFKNELRESFPVKVIEVSGAEADDIIAVLAWRYARTTDVCIYSSDKDLLQMQVACPTLKQYSMNKAGFINIKNSGYDLFEHVCRGDDGDSIPNILSNIDTFVTPGTRQKPLASKKLDEWRRYGINEPERFCTSNDMLDRFNQNRNLIDLSMIPQNLQNKIVEEYENARSNTGKMFQYLAGVRLTRVLKDGGF